MLIGHDNVLLDHLLLLSADVPDSRRGGAGDCIDPSDVPVGSRHQQQQRRQQREQPPERVKEAEKGLAHPTVRVFLTERVGLSWQWTIAPRRAPPRSASLTVTPKTLYLYSVDKFLIIPQSDVFLKYVDGSARKLLKEHAPAPGKGTGPAAALAPARIEYLQANLANDEARQKVFVAPDGNAFDVVIDLSPGDASVTGTDEVLIEVCVRTGGWGQSGLKSERGCSILRTAGLQHSPHRPLQQFAS